MGDIPRHALIFDHVRRNLGPNAQGQPVTFIEIGNFLTDISQFRDPYAFKLAKKRVWEQSKVAGLEGWDFLRHIPILGLVVEMYVEYRLDDADIDNWINDLFGSSRGRDIHQRAGALGRFFMHFLRGVTHMVFAEDVQRRQQIDPYLMEALRGLAVPSAALDRVYDHSFTQYYPHEHVDFPPYVPDGVDRVRHRLYARRPRTLIAYLVEQQRFIAEELTKLEARWKQDGGMTAPEERRQRHFADLGHLLHAVEDYYFHSNHVELRAFLEFRRTRPSTEAVDDSLRSFGTAGLRIYAGYTGYDQGYRDSELGSDTQHGGLLRWRRRAVRRLRYPRYVERFGNRNTLDDGASDPAVDFVYTGGFEENDLFHTMIGALEGLERALVNAQNIADTLSRAAQNIPIPQAAAARVPDAERLRTTDLVLLRTLFNEGFRRELYANEDVAKRHVETHRQQLATRRYDDLIALGHTRGWLNDRGRDAFLAAVAEDRRLEVANRKAPGVGGFLMMFLARAQQAVDQSRLRSMQLDHEQFARERGNAATSLETDNGATGEAIGTHSLMSKDSGHSQPLVEDARALAKHASLSLAITMLASVQAGGAGAGSGVDWEQVVRHYMRFPSLDGRSWEAQVLDTVRRTGNLPAYDAVTDRPALPNLTMTDANGRLRLLRSGNKRVELENRYNALEQRADHFQTFDFVAN